jgi:hypothetical protein
LSIDQRITVTSRRSDLVTKRKRALFSRLLPLALFALTLLAHPADAAISQSCSDLRSSVIRMENEVPSGAALSVDLAIRAVYLNDCLRHPSGGAGPGTAPNDPWFAADGSPTAGPPPAGEGVYQTTAEIAGYCQRASNPALCALMLNVGEGEMLAEGGDPKNPDDWSKPLRPIDPADALPPLHIATGGMVFSIDDECFGGLTGILFAPPGGDSLARKIASRAATPRCAAELGYLSAGQPAIQDGIARWRQSALADPTTPTGIRGRTPQPGFLEMCSQAFTNQGVCQQRQINMNTAGGGSNDLGGAGQAGTFGECASLYGAVVSMCRQAGVRFPAARPGQTTRAVPPDANKGPAREPPASAPQAPRSTPVAGIPSRCDGVFNDFLTHVRNGRGEDSQAIGDFQALQKDSECSQALGQVAGQNNLTLPRRRLDPTTRSAFAAAMAADASRPASAVVTSGPDFDAGDVINFGLGLINVMGAVHGGGIPPIGRGTDMTSIGNRPVRSTYGQGSPSGVGQRPVIQGCVQCRVGSAQ